jgi:hypothetical protein
MNGAQSLVRTLADCGIELCLANPGTSEMHVVAALDNEPRIRGVLCLFEGVAAGAADGYARMTAKPAMTLLHLGPGFANAVSHLHNARQGGQPIVNIVAITPPATRSMNRRRCPATYWASAARCRTGCTRAARPMRWRATAPARWRLRMTRRAGSPHWSCPPIAPGGKLPVLPRRCQGPSRGLSIPQGSKRWPRR